MSFCGQCGNQINPNEAFCTRCGAKASSGTQQNTELNFKPAPATNIGTTRPAPSSNDSVHRTTSSNAMGRAAMYALCQAGAYIFIGITLLFTKDLLGVLINVIMAVCAFFASYRPLKSGKAGNAILVCLVLAVFAAVVGFYAFFKDAVVYGMMYLLSGIPGYLTYNEIKKAR